MSKTTKKVAEGDRQAPPSGQPPSGNLAPRELKNLATELSQYVAEYAPLFKRREQREWSQLYLRGQLSELERKSIEPMVLRERGEEINAVRAVQQFIGEGAWDDERILERHQQLVAQDLGETDGVMIVDGSGFPKKGDHSVGVQRQYCGALGKLANCQQGVFVVYASRLGHTFVDRRLYVPKEWFDEAHLAKRQKCGVPEKLKFKTEPQLGLEMLTELAEQGPIPFRWVAVDEHYGMNPAFLDGIDRLDKWYFAEVPVNTTVWLGQPQILPPGKGQPGNIKTGRPRTGPRVAKGEASAQEARLITANLAPQDWKRYTIKEGAKGPITADFAFVRAVSKRGRRPGHEVWVVFRRSTSDPSEIKYYLSNAPATTALTELVRLAGSRWPVETAIEEAKSELGMDHYETRTWLGWHHHMTLTFLAHHFLVRLRLKLKKVSGSDAGTKQSADSERARLTRARPPARA
jgi:SRSO17 transposase